MELNYVFCEWVLYNGTAPEQKTENAQKWLKFNISATFKFLFKQIFCLFIFCLINKLFKIIELVRGSDHFIDKLRAVDIKSTAL